MAYPYLVGEPCQVVTPVLDRRRRPTELDQLCGEPSFFIYKGLVPDRLTSAQLRRVNAAPVSLLMCPDHAKALAHDFAWHIKDGKVSIERLDEVKFRFHCKNCLAGTIVQWDAKALGTNPGEFGYCPRCGAKCNGTIDPEQDYYELLSEAFGGMPVELVKMLYQEWDRRAFPKFRDYVKAEIDHFDVEGDLMSGAGTGEY